MLGLIFGLIVSVSYGVSDFAGGLASRRSPVLKVTALSVPSALLVTVAALVFVGGTPSPAAIGYGVLSGLGSMLTLLLLYRCLALGPMAILSPLVAVTGAVLSVLFGFIILREVLAPLSLLGIALALVAVILSTGSLQRSIGRPSGLAIMLALSSGVMITFQLACLKASPEEGGAIPIVAGRLAAGLLVIVVFLIWRSRTGPTPTSTRLSLAAGCLDGLASACLLLGLRNGDMSVVAVAAALYPAFTVVLAAVILRESISRIQALGLLLAVSAVILLALG